MKSTAVDQLFPTPDDLADRVVALADIRLNQRILESSAETGNLIRAIYRLACDPSEVERRITLVERSALLSQQLIRDFPAASVYTSDFLSLNVLGLFERIVMNPPFKDGADVAHIQRALRCLAPKGRLVAICANGLRQQIALKRDATEWIDLPADSFKSAGTGVNAAIAVFDR